MPKLYSRLCNHLQDKLNQLSSLLLEVTNKIEAIVKMKSDIVTKAIWESLLSEGFIAHNLLKKKKIRGILV